MVFHPGPPGDGGPSSLDWFLLGDDGTESDPKTALARCQNGEGGGRGYWGGMVFQATAEMDKGPVWAWDQFKIPSDVLLTKAQLYQSHICATGLACFQVALARIVWSVTGIGYADLPEIWVDRIVALPEWEYWSISTGQPFLGGPLHYRPLLTAKDRQIDLYNWTSSVIHSFIRASDSQPGAKLSNLTADSGLSLFVYDSHYGGRACDIPKFTYQTLGYETFDDIPAGTAIATRDGAVLFKTRPSDGLYDTLWITMARVIRPLGQALEAKIPFARAVARAGHGAILADVAEWPLDWTAYRPHEWQEIYIFTFKFHIPCHEDKVSIVQFVYWNF